MKNSFQDGSCYQIPDKAVYAVHIPHIQRLHTLEYMVAITRLGYHHEGPSPAYSRLQISYINYFMARYQVLISVTSTITMTNCGMMSLVI